MKAAPRRTIIKGVRQLALLSCLLLGIQAASAGDTKKANAYYESALSSYNQKHYDKAVIQLKNAFQENPNLLSALVLLGKAYLKTGNPAAAEVSLKDAQALGADLSLIAIPLANTYLAQFKHNQLLAQTVPDSLPLPIKTELHLLRARAALEMNNPLVVNDEIEVIESLNPMAANLLSLKALLRMRAGKQSEAESLINRLKDLYPEKETTWLADASLKQLRGEETAALESYDQVLQINPDNNDARIGRLTLLINSQQNAKVLEDFKVLKSSSTSDPRVTYLHAVYLARSGDRNGSTAALTKTLNILNALRPEIVNRNLQLLMIAAIANYNLNNLESARKYLEIYTTSAPSELAPQQLLVRTYMRQNEYHSAISLLGSMLEYAPLNATLLSLLAEAHSGAGNHQKALYTYEKALTVTKDNPQLTTQWAISKLNAGFLEEGLVELEKLFQNENSQRYSAIPFATALLNSDHFDQAVKVAEQLAEQDPESLAKQNLLAISLFKAGHTEEAKIRFSKLLKAHPDNDAIKRNLAKIALREGDFESAKNTLKKVLANTPKDPDIMLEIAQVLEAEGDLSGALRWVKDAASEAPTVFHINRYLMKLLSLNGEFDEALKVADNQEAIHPDNLHVLEAQARVLLAAQKKASLLSLLRHMATLADFNTQWLLKIGRFQMNVGSLDEASYTLFRGLQGNPGHLPTRVLLTELEIRLNRLDLAIERAKQIIKDHPEDSVGYRLVGDVRVQHQRFNDAITSYEQALKLEPSSLLTLRLFSAQRSIENEDAARTTLLNWLQQRPNDHRVKNALADFYLTSGDYALALKTYQALLTVADKNPYLHNNIAYTLYKLKDTEKSLRHAQRAYDLAPTDPMINDTLGWLLTNNGRAGQGLAYLREALTRAPENSEIRYHLAVSLHKLKRDTEARRELKLALRKSVTFEGYNQAKQLLVQLEN